MLQRKIRKSGQNRTRNVRERYLDFEGNGGEKRQVLDLTTSAIILGCIALAFLLGVVLGAVFNQNIKNNLLPQDPVALSIEHRLTMLAVGKPAFDGKKTVITHMFKGKPNHVYAIEYSPDLTTGWKAGDKHHTTDDGIFHATFDKDGNHTENWNQSMFFRVSEIGTPENNLLVNNDK